MWTYVVKINIYLSSIIGHIKWNLLYSFLFFYLLLFEIETHFIYITLFCCVFLLPQIDGGRLEPLNSFWADKRQQRPQETPKSVSSEVKPHCTGSLQDPAVRKKLFCQTIRSISECSSWLRGSTMKRVFQSKKLFSS